MPDFFTDAHDAGANSIPLPGWARACDASIAILLVLIVSVWAFGGIKLFSSPVEFSANRVSRLIALLSAVVALRHILLRRTPHPSTAARFARGVRSYFSAVPTRSAVGPWLVFRIGAVVVGVLALAAFGLPAGARPGDLHPFIQLGHRWDATWYLEIAATGYRWNPADPKGQQRVAFFPAYPLGMHAAGALLGARPEPAPAPGRRAAHYRERTLLGGWLLALACAFAGLSALYQWSARRLNRRAAQRAVMLFASFPFAVFYSAPYTEALFVLCALGSFNALERNKGWHAALWGFVAALTRPNGFLLAIPLALGTTGEPAVRRMRIAAAGPLCGLLAYSAYLWWLTGSPSAWARAHGAWGRTLSSDPAIAQTFRALTDQGLWTFITSAPMDLLNAGAVLFAAGAVPLVWKRLGAGLALWVVASLVPPLATGGLMSTGRVVATLFPLFVALAATVTPNRIPFWLAGFSLLQGLAAAMFFTWRPML